MPHPLYDQIHFLSFNRPGYTAQVAAALAGQLRDRSDPPALHAWIDGYAGSRDELRGSPDQTQSVAGVVAARLPSAEVHRMVTNIGVARLYARAERVGLRSSDSPYVLFFEDDYVPGPDYLQALERLMAWGLERPEVAIVTAHGIVAEHASLLLPDLELRLPLKPLPVHSLWAFAIKRSHLRERAAFLREYLARMRGVRYRERDDQAIRSLYASWGLPPIHGTSQDYAKHAALLVNGRLALTVPRRLGRYIGREGEHRNVETYERFGYGRLRTQPFAPDSYERALTAPFDAAILGWSRLQELMFMSVLEDAHQQRLAVAHLQAELEDARRRPEQIAERESPAVEEPLTEQRSSQPVSPELAPSRQPPLGLRHRLLRHLRRGS